MIHGCYIYKIVGRHPSNYCVPLWHMSIDVRCAIPPHTKQASASFDAGNCRQIIVCILAQPCRSRPFKNGVVGAFLFCETIGCTGFSGAFQYPALANARLFIPIWRGERRRPVYPLRRATPVPPPPLRQKGRGGERRGGEKGSLSPSRPSFFPVRPPANKMFTKLVFYCCKGGKMWYTNTVQICL